MSPSFLHGEYVLTCKGFWTRYEVGDVLIVRHDQYQTIIKRVEKIDKSRVMLSGDNPASVAAEEMGWLPFENILGKVFYRIAHTDTDRGKNI